MKGQELPNYPVVVIHILGDGLAICCGLPWHKNPVEREGTVLWFCTGCANALKKGPLR